MVYTPVTCGKNLQKKCWMLDKYYTEFHLRKRELKRHTLSRHTCTNTITFFENSNKII